MAEYIEIIANLPSAQPEQPEKCKIYPGAVCGYPIVWCSECPLHRFAQQDNSKEFSDYLKNEFGYTRQKSKEPVKPSCDTCKYDNGYQVVYAGQEPCWSCLKESKYDLPKWEAKED